MLYVDHTAIGGVGDMDGGGGNGNKCKLHISNYTQALSAGE